MQGFDWFNGSIGSMDQLVQGFNWLKGSIGLQIQSVQGFKASMSLKVQLHRWFIWFEVYLLKDTICSRVQLFQGFNWFHS